MMAAGIMYSGMTLARPRRMWIELTAGWLAGTK
jgi:hypothetical protein